MIKGTFHFAFLASYMRIDVQKEERRAEMRACVREYVYMHAYDKVSAPINYPLTRRRLTSLRANLFVPVEVCISDWSMYQSAFV